MATTTFVDYSQNTPIVAAWLNDVNKTTYTTAGTVKNAVQSAAAWVRFSVSGGVATIQQSSNVTSVTRTGTGVYVVTYTVAMTNANNCYATSMSQAGFMQVSVESTASVTITTTDVTNSVLDPAFVSVMVFGAN